MELKTVLNGIEGLKVRGSIDIDIENVENDSRKIKQRIIDIIIPTI